MVGFLWAIEISKSIIITHYMFDKESLYRIVGQAKVLKHV